MQSPIDRICIEHTKKLEELKKKNEEHRRLFLGIETKTNIAELSTYQLILQVKKLKSERNGWQEEATRLKKEVEELSRGLADQRDQNNNLRKLLRDAEREQESKTRTLQATKRTNQDLKYSFLNRIFSRMMNRRLGMGFRSWISHLHKSKAAMIKRQHHICTCRKRQR
jgi:type III secretory pathway component EscV